MKENVVLEVLLALVIWEFAKILWRLVVKILFHNFPKFKNWLYK